MANSRETHALQQPTEHEWTSDVLSALAEHHRLRRRLDGFDGWACAEIAQRHGFVAVYSDRELAQRTRSVELIDSAKGWR